MVEGTKCAGVGLFAQLSGGGCGPPSSGAAGVESDAAAALLPGWGGAEAAGVAGLVGCGAADREVLPLLSAWLYNATSVSLRPVRFLFVYQTS